MSSLLLKIRKFSLLSQRNKIRFFRYFVLLLYVKLSLRLLSFATFLRFYKKALLRQKAQEPDDFLETASLLQMATSIFPKGVTCLPLALAYKLLYANESHVTLRIGVLRESHEALSFHAWVEKDSNILINHPAAGDTFQPLWEIN